MSGAGNNAAGSTIFSENTTAGGANDVTVANLRVQQDLRVDGNFEVGTFSIDDLTVNDDLNVTDELTVGGNTYAQYLETALDINCKGNLLVEETIVCDGLASLNGGADMPPTKRLRVGSATVHTEVNETEVVVEDTSGESRLSHVRLHISNPTNTHVARVRLNGSTMEVGPSTASTLALQTGGTTRATVNATTGQVAITNGIASSSATTGALVVTGGAGISGDLYVGGTITSSTPAPTGGWTNVVPYVSVSGTQMQNAVAIPSTATAIRIGTTTISTTSTVSPFLRFGPTTTMDTSGYNSLIWNTNATYVAPGASVSQVNVWNGSVGTSATFTSMFDLQKLGSVGGNALWTYSMTSISGNALLGLGSGTYQCSGAALQYVTFYAGAGTFDLGSWAVWYQ